MKNLTIAKRIALAFAAVIAIATIMGLYSYSRAIVIKEAANSVARESLPGIAAARDMAYRSLGITMRLYKHVGSEDVKDMAQLEAEINEQRAANLTNILILEALFPTGKVANLVKECKEARNAYITCVDDILAVSRASTNMEGNAAAYRKARIQLDPVRERFANALLAVATAVNEDATKDSAAIVEAAQKTQTGILIGLILAIIAASAISMLIVRSTNHVLGNLAVTLNDESEQLSGAATQVSTASQTLAEGTSQQAAAIEETSSSLEEMSSMTKRNSTSAAQAKGLAAQTRAAADAGVADMRVMSESMADIQASSAEIGKIIKTIDEIAFQTNILALNAAVEAARAGEAGMGFAVVAEEVRTLAQRSAHAARETAQKIEGAITKTQQGVAISNKVLTQLNDIVAKIREVDDLVAEVASASDEQSQGIEQVNKAISEMDKVTQSNAATAEESASASQQLNSQAASLKKSVASLLALVGRVNLESEALNLTDRSSGPVSVEHPTQNVPSKIKISRPVQTKRIAGGNHDFADF